MDEDASDSDSWESMSESSGTSRAGCCLGNSRLQGALLSWAAKWGVPRGPGRLGYRAASKDSSLLVHSPLRLLTKMLSDVKNQSFLPDSTRSGRFVTNVVPDGHDSPKSNASTSDSPDGSDNATDSDPGDNEVACKEVVGRWGPKLDDDGVQRFVRHKTSRCIHLLDDEGGAHLKCGRRINPSYILLLAKPTFMHPLCSVCFPA